MGHGAMAKAGRQSRHFSMALKEPNLKKTVVKIRKGAIFQDRATHTLGSLWASLALMIFGALFEVDGIW
jgi:hypothetical protein